MLASALRLPLEANLRAAPGAPMRLRSPSSRAAWVLAAAISAAPFTTTLPAEEAPPRLDLNAVPTAQSVDLTVDPGKPDYTGTVTIALDVKQSTDVLRFHARSLTIDTATLQSAGKTLKPAAIEKL